MNAGGADELWTLVPAQALVAEFLSSFREYPPSQKSGSFDVSRFLDALPPPPVEASDGPPTNLHLERRASRPLRVISRH